MPEIQQFARRVVEQNIQNLVGSAGFSRRSFTTVYLMYVIMFVVGVGAAVVAVIRGFIATTAPESVTSFAFAGLTAASFFTLFLIRPLESIERDSIFSSWLTAAVNTYWTRLWSCPVARRN